MNKNDQTSHRFMELEGLRGLAAVSVVIFHFLVLFFPMMYYGSSYLQHSRFEDNVHGSPVAALISGTFSVSIFFVLSGFVLSVGFFKTKSQALVRKLAIKRYLRLMLPALASVLIAFVLLSLFPNTIVPVQAITHSPALPIPWVAHPEFWQAIYEGTVGVFIEGPVNNYNSVLWTMKYEFIGSFIIFTFLILFGNAKLRWLLYPMLLIGLYNTWFIGLIIGMIFADIYVHKKELLQRIPTVCHYLLLVCGIAIGSFPHSSAEGTIYNFAKLPWLEYAQNQSLYTAVGATLVVIAVVNIGLLKTFLSSRIMSKLGGLTYSLYLVHQPIIYVCGMTCFMLLSQHYGYTKSVFFTLVLTLPLIILATLVFHRYVELPSMQLAAYFEKVYSGQRAFITISDISSIFKVSTANLMRIKRWVQYVARFRNAISARFTVRRSVAELESEAD